MPRRNPAEPRGDAYSARIRAAVGYADKSRKQVAEALGVSVETVSSLYAGAPTTSEIRNTIRELCGVPEWFMEDGFDVRPESVEPTLVETVEALSHRVATLEREVLPAIPSDERIAAIARREGRRILGSPGEDPGEDASSGAQGTGP